MNEGQFKKKMQHFLKINNDLYKENQVLKKALILKDEKILELQTYIITLEKSHNNLSNKYIELKQKKTQ